MIKKLAHVCLFTTQLDAMIAFYRDTLGMPVKFTMKNDKGFASGYYFACGDTTFIELFDRSDAAKQSDGKAGEVRPSPHKGLQHLCLEVEDLEGVVAQLTAKGVTVRPISVGVDHSKQAWIKDPDGNDIELMEYTPKSLQL